MNQMNNYKVDKIDNIVNMFDKYTQKYYPLQNYDLFPEMYHIIDAETKTFENQQQNKQNQMTQTVRYMLRDIQTPYSSLLSSPPSSNNSGFDYPVPTPSETSNNSNDIVQPENHTVNAKVIRNFFINSKSTCIITCVITYKRTYFK